MNKLWWKYSNIYQIWPKSFKDSNADGYGDLGGIIEKLDYIKNIGFDAIWISPFYSSPMVDNGYDIENYLKIDKIFGNDSDFDELIAACNKRELKVLIDIVLNHTSSKHKWFVESSKSKDSYYSDYYVWRDEIPEKTLERSSINIWTYVESRKQFYLHTFDKTQPDLNWENPKVLEEFVEILLFWIKKGVSGFRFDVIELIGKDIENGIFENGPTLHSHIKKIIFEAKITRDFLTVGECWRTNDEITLNYTKEENEELSMIFSFKHVALTKEKLFRDWSVYRKPKAVEIYENFVKHNFEIIKKGGWLSNVFENHDLPRCVSVYGSEDFRTNSAKTLALLQYVTPGTPCIYQGQELGLINYKAKNINEFVDIDAIRKYNKLVLEEKKVNEIDFLNVLNKLGRDNARRIMPWNNGANLGFSSVEPWINFSNKTITVDEQLKDEKSVLHFFKKLNSLKKSEYSELLINGELIENNVEKNLIDFSIAYKDKKIRYIGNFGKELFSTEFENEKKVILDFDKKQKVKKLLLKEWESILLEE